MSCLCPEGYIFNSTSNLCEKTVVVDAGLNPNPQPTKLVCGSSIFMNLGTLFFPETPKENYPIIGNNEIPPQYIDSSSNVINSMANLLTPMWSSDGNIYGGRLNQAGVGLLPPLNDWQGYSKCIIVEEDQIYSIGLAANYGFRVYIDGELAIYYKPAGTVNAAAYMHVIPLDLTLGKHNILAEAISNGNGICKDINGFEIDCNSGFATTQSEECPNLGVFLMELYLNVTPQILSNASNQQELNTLYAKYYINNVGEYITTAVFKGNPMDTGINGNYSCSSGAINGCIESRVVCKSLETLSPSVCCFILINCATGGTIITDTDLSTYLDKVIKIENDSNCYLINVSSDEDCSGAVSVVVDTYYDSCVDCTRKYYRLTDCTGQATSIVTSTDLVDYLGKVVKISGYNVCWLVVRTNSVDDVEVEIVEFYNTCEQCL